MREQILIPVLMLSGFALFMGVIFRFAAITSRKAVENVQRLADRLRLQLVENKPVFGFHRSPEAVGVIRNKKIRLYNYTTGTGKSKTIWAALSVAPAVPVRLTFALSHQGIGTKLREIFGAKEIKVGHKDFDRDWFVQTNEPDFFGAALLPEIQQKIQSKKGTWKLADNLVVYAERGSFADVQRTARFESLVDVACDLADIAEVHVQQLPKR